jgi:hypothetical protein
MFHNRKKGQNKLTKLIKFHIVAFSMNKNSVLKMNFTINPLSFKLFSIFDVSVLSDTVFLTSEKLSMINRND